MPWEILKYSKFEINNAGKVLIRNNSSEQDKDKALEILDNWRAVHSYPMHVFQMRLRDRSLRLDSNPIIAQRLKRVPAIIYKLKRSFNGRRPSMKLYQMQDIGGCRAVLSNISDARKLCEDYYLKGDLKHKRVNFKDYIHKPKDDGYRGLHLVYEYKSDKKGKKQLFNGLRIEVQIRSKLQHLWATAVETVDFFTRQPIKTSEGNPEWANFFKFVSSAFAMLENCPSVPNTPMDEKELYSDIKKKEKELGVVSKMRGWTSGMKYFEEEIKTKVAKKVKYFLLELDILGNKLNITSYAKEEEQKALSEYSAIEKRHSGQKDYDMVLVGVDAVKDLKKAYPNYFVDTGEFLSYLDKIVKKY